MAWIKSILVALSTLKELLSLGKSLWAKYEKSRAAKKTKEINKAIDEGSTSDIEKAIGSDTAGKPTKYPYGVQRRRKNTSGDVGDKQ